MESNWAAEHLQVIRTLMERSSVYRRALAPIMFVSGTIGTAAALIPLLVKPLTSNREFSLFWIFVSALALLASFLLVRRQALKEAEAFWSLPTRRVSQALAPAFFVGLSAGAIFVWGPLPDAGWVLALFWIVIYGCALHAAAFFMQRGIKLFAWLFILAGTALGLGTIFFEKLQTATAAHSLMGVFFGLLHLAYGVYLYFTEKK
ncbi:MAG TPA: hypothetical protein VGE41_13150 [Verrucomicrobiae bacterium]